MRILLVCDPTRPDRAATFAALALGLRRLDQDVRVLDPGKGLNGPARVLRLAVEALVRRPLLVDASAASQPRIEGFARYVAVCGSVPLPRIRIDARGHDFVLAPADMPLTFLPHRGQRVILLAGETAPLPRRPAERWARTIRRHHELVFPTRSEWHRALAEAPHLAACATRIVSPGDGTQGWEDDPMVAFARRVIGFTLSPSRPTPRLPATCLVPAATDVAMAHA
jgi:hypothetical protein